MGQLRLHFMQQWFTLSSPGMEEATQPTIHAGVWTVGILNHLARDSPLRTNLTLYMSFRLPRTIKSICEISDAPAFKCSECDQIIESNHSWSLDGDKVCDDCYESEIADLRKCKMDDCFTYDKPDNFRNGYCESCDEIYPDQKSGGDEDSAD